MPLSSGGGDQGIDPPCLPVYVKYTVGDAVGIRSDRTAFQNRVSRTRRDTSRRKRRRTRLGRTDDIGASDLKPLSTASSD